MFASLLALAATGCFVADEMDKAAKLDNSYSAPGAKVVAKTAGAAEPAAAGKDKPKPGAPATTAAADAKPAAPQGAAWWKTASSVTSEEGDSSIGRCLISGRTQFMQHDDCIARGGKPQ